MPNRDGLARAARPSYLGVMALLPRPASPRGLFRDLRNVFGHRHRHGLLFAVLSVGATAFIGLLFLGDFKHKREWHRNVQYVESWDVDRSDALIKAQQKIDQAKRDIAEAELEKRKAEQREQYRKLQKQMEKIGF